MREAVMLAVLLLTALPARAGTCTDPSTGRILEWGPGGSPPEACRTRRGGGGARRRRVGHRTPGLIDKLFGGGRTNASEQNAVNQQNANAAADNARIAAERAAQEHELLFQQTRPPLEPPPEPPVSDEDKREALGMMRGLGSSPDAKKKDDDLQLRGFEPSKKPALARGMKHCSDCLGVFQGESKGCDAIVSDFQKRVECINRALGVWDRCVGSADCPAEQRPKLPAHALSKKPRVPASPYFAGEWYLEDDADPAHKEFEPFAKIARTEDRWRISFHGDAGPESYDLDSDARQVRFLRYKGKSSTEELVFDLKSDNRTIALHQLFDCFGPPDCKKGGATKSVTSILTKKE